MWQNEVNQAKLWWIHQIKCHLMKIACQSAGCFLMLYLSFNILSEKNKSGLGHRGGQRKRAKLRSDEIRQKGWVEMVGRLIMSLGENIGSEEKEKKCAVNRKSKVGSIGLIKESTR